MRWWRWVVGALLALPAAKVAWALAPLLAREAAPAKEEHAVARLLAVAAPDATAAPAVTRCWLLSEATDRLIRDVYVALAIILDYLRAGSAAADDDAAWAALHQRGADRLLALCEVNRGVYIKLGQHVGQLDYLLPQPYVATLRVLTHAAPRDPPHAVRAVVRAELGASVDDLFDDWDDTPIASASLAQVHAARLKGTPTRVAVKVQHAGLRDTSAADLVTVRALVTAARALFPRADYVWLADEIDANLPRELNFALEAANCTATAAAFAHRSDIVAPTVVPALTTPRVLTMSFEDGVYVNDVAAIRRMGLHPAAVATLVAEAFADQIFVQGRVHADPHAANLLVRRHPTTPGAPQLVLLDHGLYRVLPPDLRLNYARLWRAILWGDEAGIARYSERMGAGGMHRLWASMLTTKSWDAVAAAGADPTALRVLDTPAHRREARGYARQYADDIGVVLRTVPRELLLILKTNDCLRCVDAALGHPVNNLAITARAIERALAAEATAAHPGALTTLLNALAWAATEVRMAAITTYLSWLAWWAAPPPPP